MQTKTENLYKAQNLRDLTSPSSVEEELEPLTPKTIKDKIILAAIEVYQTKPEQIATFRPEDNIISCTPAQTMSGKHRFFSPHFKSLESQFSEKMGILQIPSTEKWAAVQAFSKTLNENKYTPKTPSDLLLAFTASLEDFIKQGEAREKAIAAAAQVEGEEYAMAASEQTDTSKSALKRNFSQCAAAPQCVP